MTNGESEALIKAYIAHVGNKEFPCVGARAAMAGNKIRTITADHMACPKDDKIVLKFLYDFVDEYRSSKELFLSAAVIFKEPEPCTEEMFDKFLWQRLQALSDLDSQKYPYDKRVDANPASAKFSFSLKEEAFFIVGLHSSSSRRTRQFQHPCLVFNPHDQFERLRKANQYEKMKRVVRNRDIAFSGSVNPMLRDFGETSEVYQYSGINYDAKWQCPLKVNHGKNQHDPSP